MKGKNYGNWSENKIAKALKIIIQTNENVESLIDFLSLVENNF